MFATSSAARNDCKSIGPNFIEASGTEQQQPVYSTFKVDQLTAWRFAFAAEIDSRTKYPTTTLAPYKTKRQRAAFIAVNNRLHS